MTLTKKGRIVAEKLWKEFTEADDLWFEVDFQIKNAGHYNLTPKDVEMMKKVRAVLMKNRIEAFNRMR